MCLLRLRIVYVHLKWSNDAFYDVLWLPTMHLWNSTEASYHGDEHRNRIRSKCTAHGPQFQSFSERICKTIAVTSGTALQLLENPDGTDRTSCRSQLWKLLLIDLTLSSVWATRGNHEWNPPSWIAMSHWRACKFGFSLVHPRYPSHSFAHFLPPQKTQTKMNQNDNASEKYLGKDTSSPWLEYGLHQPSQIKASCLSIFGLAFLGPLDNVRCWTHCVTFVWCGLPHSFWHLCDTSSRRQKWQVGDVCSSNFSSLALG